MPGRSASNGCAAARGHLARGKPIYCTRENTPFSLVEKHYPDGRRQLVRFDLAGEHVVGGHAQAEALLSGRQKQQRPPRRWALLAMPRLRTSASEVEST